MFQIGRTYNASACTRTCKGVTIHFPTHRPKDFESTTKRLLGLGMSTEKVTAYWHHAIANNLLKEPYTYAKTRAPFFQFLAPRTSRKATKTYDAVAIRKDRMSIVADLTAICA